MCTFFMLRKTENKVKGRKERRKRERGNERKRGIQLKNAGE